MADRNQSIFSIENSGSPYFFVTGLTQDNFMRNGLAVSTLSPVLRDHLAAQGFDAIVFFDSRRMLHFYDVQSSFIARYERKPTQAELNAIHRGGAGAGAVNGTPAPTPAPAPARTGFVRRGNHARQRAEETEQVNRDYPDAREMNMGLISGDRSWRLLERYLRKTDLRTALVLNDVQDIQLHTALLRVLMAPLENRAENHNIIVFVTNAGRKVSLQEALMPPNANIDWQNFVHLQLLPLLSEEASGEARDHILNITPPNASEIRNMLLLSALNGEINLESADLEQICERLAVYAKERNQSLSELIGRIRSFGLARTLDANAAVELTGWKKLESVQERLEKLIGMQTLKDYFAELTDEMQVLDEKESIFSQPSDRLLPNRFASRVRGHGLNLLLLGNPGTGKSKAAELIGGLYREVGVLPTGHTVPVAATELTDAAVLHEFVRRAIGGVLIIDEAYALMNTVMGQQIIDALVADMGTYAGQFAVVFAGYSEPTRLLMESNDGLRRRIGKTIELPDYTWEEIEQIFFRMADQDDSVDASGLQTGEDAAKTDHIFQGWVQDAGPGWGNAGEAEKLLTEMKRNSASRHRKQNIAEADGKLRLTVEDFPEKLQVWAVGQEESLQDAFRELENCIGLGSVKQVIYSLIRTIQMSPERVQEPGFYVFQGPPGTGKTMIADTMGYLFQKLGVIGRRIPVKYTARELMQPPKATRPGERQNPNANSLQQALTESENAILFIDEAHQLADDEKGREIIRTLVPKMEEAEFRMHHCIILAGYITEMERLFAQDSGLSSRFPLRNRITFKNYTASELRDILEFHAKKMGETPEEGFLARSEVAFSKYLVNVPRNFGNARFIRNEYIPNAQRARNDRLAQESGAASVRELLSQEQLDSMKQEAKHTLTAADIPADFRVLAGPADALPEPPMDAERMADVLFGKEEIRSFIRMIRDGRNTGKHYTIAGPQGCGKETAIRAIAAALAEQEQIHSTDVDLCGQSKLVAGYVGQTALKTRTEVTNAQGGTVILVNPSSFLPKSATDNSFGPEAIQEFLNCISEFGDHTSFVLMDTEAGMEAFQKAYPSVRGMFDRHFVLDDLDISDMQSLFRLKTKNEVIFSEEIVGLTDDFVANWTADRGGLGKDFLSWSNGEEIERLIQKLKAEWEQRGGAQAQNERKILLPVITREMFPLRLREYLKPAHEEKEDVLNAMKDEIGLDDVKAAIRAIEVRMRRTAPEYVTPGNYCFVGNPGTGKTRMAKRLGSVLRATGALQQGMVISRTAREMMEQVGDFEKIVRTARGNVLFIDEAHQLATDVRGVEVIKKLLTTIEDVEITKNTCFVLAGYEQEMQMLFARDSGLKSRFGMKDSVIRFADYSAKELTAILKIFGKNAAKEPQIGSDRAFDLSSTENELFLREAESCFEAVISRNDREFGNARFARNLLHDALSEQLLRLDALHPNNEPIPEEERRVLLPQDIPGHYRRSRRNGAQQRSSAHILPASAQPALPDQPILPEVHATVLNEIRKSILLLERQDENGNTLGYGTGFVISEDGYILTCEHVLKDASRVRARLFYPGMIGGERWFEDCSILHPMYPEIDMALLKINGAGGFAALSLRSPEKPIMEDEQLMLCGYPFGEELRLEGDPNFVPSAYYNTIASIQQRGSALERIYMGGEGKSGNSGSPVISRTDGKVIGVFDGSITHESDQLLEEINYFTPIRMAWECFFQEEQR